MCGMVRDVSCGSCVCALPQFSSVCRPFALEEKIHGENDEGESDPGIIVHSPRITHANTNVCRLYLVSFFLSVLPVLWLCVYCHLTHIIGSV